MSRRVRVFGPAYWDRVLRVGGPLRPDSRPLDRSADGQWIADDSPWIRIQSLDGGWDIERPDDWSGATGMVRLNESIGLDGQTLSIRSTGWLDDLGGMGAGYAKALHGELISALGDADDPPSAMVSRLLMGEKIAHRPIRVSGRSADWTLLISSGGHGDKLAIGFRGCHSSLNSWNDEAETVCDLTLAASLTNALAADALRRSVAPVKVFAPARRNMQDCRPSVASFADAIDILCCNREEWDLLPSADQARIRDLVPMISITDGPAGGMTMHDSRTVVAPAFPRAHPPVDTNRAGEAYAAAWMTHLLDAGWLPGEPASSELIHAAMVRGSAAASLTLDLDRFGFPDRAQVDEALRRGRVGD